MNMEQELFNYMADEHGVLLLDSDMREIIRIVLSGVDKDYDPKEDENNSHDIIL